MGTEFINPIDPMLAPEHYRPLRVTPLMPNFAARIEGIDLSTDLTEDVRIKLRQAFFRFGVLFFPDQKPLLPQRQVELASVFGEPDNGSPFIEKRASQVDVIVTDEKHPPFTNLWHSDNTGLPASSMGTLIQIQNCPRVGGNTGWSCTRKAYDCLSDQMKLYLDGLVAIHYWDKRGRWSGNALIKGKEDFEKYFKWLEKLPPQEHPVVLEHPITKTKSIYVNETFTSSIIGLHRYESNAILEFLFSWVRMPEFYLAHHWQENDVAVWDNFTMQHYALADYQATRVNQRVQFAASQSSYAMS